MRIAQVFSLGFFSFAFVVASPGCSTTFDPTACTKDADCGDSAYVCAEGATPRACVAAKDAPLRIGMAAPASGPNQDLGIEMKRGIDLAFSSQNALGGVRGRPITLDFQDDEYQPALAEKAANLLCDVKAVAGKAPRCPTTLTPPAGGAAVGTTQLDRGPNAVLAVIGNVGTPTMVRFAPIAVETGTLFFGAFTGATTMLRNDLAGDCKRYIFNVRASYADETQATMEYFHKRGINDYKHVVSFDQNDSFGQAGYDGITAAEAAVLNDVPAGQAIARFRYTRDDTTSVPTQVAATEAYLTQLLAADTANHQVAFELTATYGPAVDYIKALRTWQVADATRGSRLSFLFSAVSFVGPNSLVSRLHDAGNVSGPGGTHALTDDMFVSQVVPNYQDDPSDVVANYLAQLAPTGAAPNFTSLEGYVAGRVFLAGLLAHTGDFTPDALITTFENLPPLSLGLGASSGFASTTHNYSRTVWGTSLTADGKFANVYYWSEGTAIRFFE